jgi:hypothetical protein
MGPAADSDGLELDDLDAVLLLPEGMPLVGQFPSHSPHWRPLSYSVQFNARGGEAMLDLPGAEMQTRLISS